MAVKRLQLSKKVVRELAAEASGIGYSGPTFKSIEEVVLKKGSIYLVEGRPLFVRRGEQLVPHLSSVEECFRLPSVVVDMGAVPHVVNGADVMAPGIVRVDGNFAEGSVVVVRDEKYGKAIAVGVALIPSETLPATRRGKVVKNLHYVGDVFWETVKELRSD